MNQTGLKLLNKLPASNTMIQQLISPLSNFDDLWFYYYHERHYDILLSYFFSSLETYQMSRWDIF
jgi:hypothetical protein